MCWFSVSVVKEKKEKQGFIYILELKFRFVCVRIPLPLHIVGSLGDEEDSAVKWKFKIECSETLKPGRQWQISNSRTALCDLKVETKALPHRTKSLPLFLKPL